MFRVFSGFPFWRGSVVLLRLVPATNFQPRRPAACFWWLTLTVAHPKNAEGASSWMKIKFLTFIKLKSLLWLGEVPHQTARDETSETSRNKNTISSQNTSRIAFSATALSISSVIDLACWVKTIFSFSCHHSTSQHGVSKSQWHRLGYKVNNRN